MPRVGPDGWERAVDRVRAQRVYLIPNLNGQRSLWVQATDLQGTLALSHSDNLLDARRIAIKRVIDLLLAIPLLILLAPLLLTLVALVRVGSQIGRAACRARVCESG